MGVDRVIEPYQIFMTERIQLKDDPPQRYFAAYNPSVSLNRGPTNPTYFEVDIMECLAHEIVRGHFEKLHPDAKHPNDRINPLFSFDLQGAPSIIHNERTISRPLRKLIPSHQIKFLKTIASSTDNYFTHR